tara:strand:- start:509 stop:1480 length:972 start_codon:yes stop_codon:yes gene_type:complete
MDCIDQVSSDRFHLYRGDCVRVLQGLPDDSIGYSIFSPPFASLYTYSDDPRDMGNCRNDAEFFGQFRYLLTELHRVMMPGRLVSIHCMDVPMTKIKHQVIGLRDFSGEIIRAMEDAGFVLHCRVTIWKDPVTAMQRTKSIGLLYKQLRKDSAMSRQGYPDYLVTFYKPGKSAPIEHTHESFPVAGDRNPHGVGWQEYASPVWTGDDATLDDRRLVGLRDKFPDPVWWDINPSDTLQYRSAREHDDERHICPLQVPVIARGLDLWSNPDDVVLSPFAGIGSEGVTALRLGRRFVGVELKRSYYQQASINLHAECGQQQLFGGAS